MVSTVVTRELGVVAAVVAEVPAPPAAELAGDVAPGVRDSTGTSFNLVLELQATNNVAVSSTAVRRAVRA